MAHANTTRSVRQNRKKKRSWLKIISLLFILAAVAGAVFASSGFFDKPKSAATDGMLVAKDKATIMIMGVDERDDDVGRSDTLMIATIDPKKDQAALLSIPRDTRVKIKGHGFDKINAAYAYGGHKLSRETVENFLGTPMDHYVIINIRAFQRIIDAIGGIDIDVEKRMYYEDPWDDDGGLLIDLRPGMQHMDGKTAVTYVRYRDEEGDIGRISRQQKFMKALMDKMASPSIIPQIPAIIKEISNSIKTDMSVREMLEFAGTLKEAQKNGLKTDMVPGRPLYIDEISYWIPDITKLRSTIANTLGISMNSSMRSAMEREQSEYENSIPSGATEVPATDTSVGKLRPSIREDTSTKNNKTSDTKKSGDTKKLPDSDSGDRKSQPADTTDSPPAGTATSVPPRTTTSPSPPRIGDNTGKTQ